MQAIVPKVLRDFFNHNLEPFLSDFTNDPLRKVMIWLVWFSDVEINRIRFHRAVPVNRRTLITLVFRTHL
jgi:hypothetical protein